MHFLITALGSYGDVHPMIALGVSLRERGHEVEIIANPHFSQEIHASGLTLTTIGTEEEYLELTRHPDLWSPLKSGGVIFKQAALRYLEPLYECLAKRARPGETTLIAHGLDLASRVAREKLNIKVAGATFAPMALRCDYQPPRAPVGWFSPRLPWWVNYVQFELMDWLGLGPILWPAINQLRRRIGLPTSKGSVLRFLYNIDLTLCLFPEWFAPIAPGWPRNTQCTGFPLWDGAAHRPLSDACQAFLADGAPPIVFTPGSANRYGAAYLAQAVKVCQRLGRRGVLLTKFDEQVPKSLPSSVAHFAFEPLTKILPHAAAFVHHGGIGSSSQALAAGTPQLIRPQAFDQFDNAARLIKLGVATELLEKHFNERSAAEKIDKLLNSDKVAKACHVAASKCDGPAARQLACEALEALSHGPNQ